VSGLVDNPFFVLELPVTASAREVEREAARLLGMLELGLVAAATYRTPLGVRDRRAEDVRAAAAALRDPRKRLVAELWAMGGAEADAGAGADSGEGSGAGSAAAAVSGAGAVRWTDGFRRTGWGSR
jgi:hypothetical protein